MQYNRLTYGGELGMPDVEGSEELADKEASPRVTTVSGAEFDTFYEEERETFDVAFSMSSLDHDGKPSESSKMEWKLRRLCRACCPQLIHVYMVFLFL
jgi:hypothetical protein